MNFLTLISSFFFFSDLISQVYLGDEQVNNLTNNLALQNQQQILHHNKIQNNRNHHHQNNNLINSKYPPINTPPLPPSKNLLATINQQNLKTKNNNITNKKYSHALTLGKDQFLFFVLIDTKLPARF